MTIPPKRILLAFLLLLPTIGLFLLANSTPSRSFRSFASLTWQPQPGCTLLVEKAHALDLVSRMLTWGEANKGKSIECTSDWFVAKGTELVIEYSGKNLSSSHNVAVTLESSDGEIARFDLPRYQLSGIWHLHRFKIDQPHQQLRLRLLDHDPDIGWVSLRNRVNFYDSTQSFLVSSLRSFAQQNVWAVLILFSCALYYWLYLAYGIAQNKPKLFFLMLWFGVTALFVRPDAFFYMDEWHVMQRLHASGWSSAFHAHNEHFIPLFFLSYFIQLKLFSSSYLGFILISTALLTLAGILCGKVAALFSPRGDAIAPLIAIGFCISALHGETLEWAMVQGALYAMILRTIALLAAVHYLRTEQRRAAVITVIAAFLAPLFFGAGLLAFSDIFLLFVFARFFFPLNPTALFKVLVALIFALILVVMLYAIAANDGVATSTSQSFSLVAYLKYISLGTVLGSITRGLGAWPLAELTADNQMFAILASISIAGSLLVLSKRIAVSRLLPTLLFGLALTASVFILTGIGRASFGATQALALRYCSLSLLGVSILILPALEGIFELRKQRNLKHLTTLLALLFVFSQIYLNTNFNYYWKQGALTRDFVTQVEDWNSVVGRVAFDPIITYEANKTPYAGLMPLAYGGHVQEPSAQISILHPDTMAALTAKYLPQH